ncbi:unnamed protein product [Dibothriocephalus latus]|uniref:Uncharacterized protein n=1 Tax=Dibothriocephalus latus TaxID=60516 RepID=A0A3P7QRT6_DIBLA|nr:unnamed protein product [Dibothriocephalus latus]
MAFSHSEVTQAKFPLAPRWRTLAISRRSAEKFILFGVSKEDHERKSVVQGFAANAANNVEEFLVRGGHWRSQPPLAVARYSHAAAAVKVSEEKEEKMLLGVFGGWGAGSEEIASCEVYDFSQQR